MPDPGPFKRPLYPPNSAKGPVKDGADVEAVKRAISRAGFWEWGEFDDAYNNAFALGGDKGKGVKGFQKKVGLDPTGNYGEQTHKKLKAYNVPSGPNEGEDCFDGRAADLYSGYKPPPEKTPEERIREQITAFCKKAIAEPDWYYSQNRAVDVSVSPEGPNTSDCSGAVIQAFNYAKRQTGLAVKDPAKQGWSGYGNTNYYEDDWPTVTSGKYEVGDLAHYDGHVNVCYEAGNWDTSTWFSFGSEPPSSRKLDYRSDFRKVVRPDLL